MESKSKNTIEKLNTHFSTYSGNGVLHELSALFIMDVRTTV